MLILAADTGGRACSVALWRDGDLLWGDSRAMLHGHAEALLPMIMRGMAETALAFAALDLLAVAVGPGAFTGLRAGIAGLGGLALASGRPILGVSSLAAAAASAALDTPGNTRPILAVIDSRRGDWFAQAFGPDLAPLGAVQLVPPEALASLRPGDRFILTGDAAEAALAALPADPAVMLRHPGPIDCRALARIAAARAAEAGATPPEPAYLRPPEARAPADPRRPS